MGLKKPTPKRAIIRAFRDGLNDMIRQSRIPDDLSQDGDAQQINVLDVAAVAQGKRLEAATPVLWEFLVGGVKRQPAVQMAVAVPRRRRDPVMTSFVCGPVAAAAIRRLRAVETLPRVRGRAYELQHLSIVALGINGFWLKSKEKGQPDLLVPYRTIHRQLQSMKPYTSDEFFAVVRPLAQKHLEEHHELKLRSRRGQVTVRTRHTPSLILGRKR